MICGKEPIDREQIIARYLARSLDVDAVEEFEGHYLGCDECFDELRVSDRLVLCVCAVPKSCDPERVMEYLGLKV